MSLIIYDKNKKLDNIMIIVYSISNMKETLYSTKQMLEITGESNQRIQYWILNGVLAPSNPGSGTGTSRGYSIDNLLAIMVAKALSQNNFPIKLVAYFIKQINRDNRSFFKTLECPSDINEQAILSIKVNDMGGTLSNVTTFKELKGQIELLLRNDWPIIILNLDMIKAELKKRLSEGK
jgi:hypothetical protein